MTEKVKRGFALMDKARLKKISRLGGQSVPPEKRTFFDKELAKREGSKGGKASKPENRSFSRDRELAARASKKANAFRKLGTN